MDRFSRINGIEKEQAELDFVDITIGVDTPLYVDPLLIF